MGSKRGSRFTEPTERHPKPLVHPKRPLVAALRENGRGETVMEYGLFCGLTVSSIEQMLEKQAKKNEQARQERFRRRRMTKIKS